MHCETAPCELVCPVGATVHSPEGLNEMVYNRCVGTRYCSNNCPYKVRRFNFLHYADFATPSLKLQRNPDVTVRGRGVMEKCTYCVQRIREAEIAAQNSRPAAQGRRRRDGLPGRLPGRRHRFRQHRRPEKPRDASSRSSPLNYGLLAELNTRPRTTYLAGGRQPEPGSEPRRRPRRSDMAADAQPKQHGADQAARSSGRGTPSPRSPTRSARSC